ncbi:MAG: hypothetical protein AB7E39_04640 [Endomicrobiaceae bacterium]
MTTYKYKPADVYRTNAYTDTADSHLTAACQASGNYKAYKINFGNRYILNITSTLIHNGNAYEDEKICLNMLSNSNNKTFLKLGSFWTLVNIYFNQNNFKKAYFYIKETSKINHYDITASERPEKTNSILERYQ